MGFSRTNQIKNNLADKIFNNKNKIAILINKIIMEIIIIPNKEESSVEIKINRIL